MANRKVELQGYTKKVLASMAKDKGVPGWHAMRKDELVAALSKATTPRSQKSRPKRSAAAASTRSVARRKRNGDNGTKQLKTALNNNSSKYHAETSPKDLSRKVPSDLPNGYGKDRIVVMVRDPFWLHAY